MKRVYRGEPWPGLEEALVSEVRRARDADPLRPIDVLVGSNLLGLYLKRLLARRFGALAAVRPLTFLDLARRWAERSLLSTGLRPLPRLGEEILVGHAVAALAGGAYFEPVRSFPGFRPSLLASIRDLKDAGWTPPDLEHAIVGGRGPAESRTKLLQLLKAFERYEGGLRTAGFYDRSDLLARAGACAEDLRDPRSNPGEAVGDRRGLDGGRSPAPARASRAGPESPLLLVYGFYDLLEVQWRLLRAVARFSETVVFVPSGDGPPLAFARPLLAKLEREGFDVHETGNTAAPLLVADTPAAPDREASEAPASSASRVEEGPATGSPPRHGSRTVRVLSAPGESRQAAEITRQVIAWAEEGIRFGDMAVLARLADPALTEAARALERARVPYVLSAGRPFTASRAARTALHLLKIPSSEWGRDEVISFLAIADPPSGSASTDVPLENLHVDPAEWDLVSAEAGIVKGKESWSRELSRMSKRAYAALKELEGDVQAAGAPDRQDDDGVSGSDAIEEARRRLARSRSLEDAITRLGRALDLWPPTGAWSECSKGFLCALRAFLSPSSELEDLEEVLDGLGSLDPLGPCPDREVFADLVRRALEARAIRDRRFQRDGVLVSTIEAARGLSFRAVAVAGMAEKIFPAHVHEDPLLLDAERERLARAAPRLAPLPRKGDRFEEERLLFHLAVASARERLLLSWSRLSESEDRECLPSPFLREAAGPFGARLATGVEDHESNVSAGSSFQPMLETATTADEPRISRERLETITGDLPSTVRIPLLPLAPADAELAIDTAEWLLSCASREAPRDGPISDSDLSSGEDARSPRGKPGFLRALRPDRHALLDQLCERHSFLSRALACERERHDLRRFGPYDGFLGESAARQAFERLVSGSVSPTRIDEYASCPFKAFMGRILGVRALRDPVEVESIEPRDRGTVVHRILAEFLGGLAKDEHGRLRLASWPPEALHARLRESASKGFEWAERRFPVGYPLLWQIEQSRILDWLARWVDAEIEDAAATGYVPTAFEWSFGFDDDPQSGPALELTLPTGRLLLHGKLDRIDLDAEGRRARVIDYKTSVRPLTTKKVLRRIEEGRGTQLPVYLMAAARLGGADAPPVEVVSAGYHYLVDGTKAGLDADAWTSAKDSFFETMDTLLSAARSGDFTADPREGGFCGICDFQVPCGQSRMRIFERKKRDVRVAARLGLREGESST